MIKSLDDINNEFEQSWTVQQSTDAMRPVIPFSNESDAPALTTSALTAPINRNSYEMPATYETNRYKQGPPDDYQSFYNQNQNQPEDYQSFYYQKDDRKDDDEQNDYRYPELNYEDALEAHRSMASSAKELDYNNPIGRSKDRNTVADLESPEGGTVKRKRKKKNRASYLSDFLFYTALALVLVATFTMTTRSNGGPVLILGHSFMTVLTGSMQDVYPQGSLILVKEVDTAALNIGDDITYMKDEMTSVTHRIVNIFENFSETGFRGFQTQGVNNPTPDETVVDSRNVVGRVLFHIPVLGKVILEIGNHLYIIFIVFGLFMIASFVIKAVFGKSGGATGNKKRPARKQGKNSGNRVTVYNGAGLSAKSR